MSAPPPSDDSHSNPRNIIFPAFLESIVVEIILVVIGAYIAAVLGRAVWRGFLSWSIETKIRFAFRWHLDALARQYLMLVRKDNYGRLDLRAWNREMMRFYESVIVPKLTRTEIRHITDRARKTGRPFKLRLDRKIVARARAIEKRTHFQAGMTPRDFEVWCTRTLTAAGWKATTTKSSGDQGADVLVEKGGIRAVIQCKLYSKAVGNKAIQEAFTAQKHYRANASAVVTNSTFTPSARELANSTRVLLLHVHDLPRFDELVRAAGPLPMLTHGAEPRAIWR